MHLIIYTILNGLGLWLADRFIAGFVVVPGLKEYAISAIILAILNLVAKPILKFITFPIILLTLGLFNLVLNAILIWATAAITGYIIIDGAFALAGTTLILAITNIIAHHLIRHD